MTKGRVLPFRTGDPLLDCVLRWAAREHPDLLVRWGKGADTPIAPPVRRPEAPTARVLPLALGDQHRATRAGLRDKYRSIVARTQRRP